MGKFYILKILIAPFQVAIILLVRNTGAERKKNILKDSFFLKKSLRIINEIRLLELLRLGESRYVMNEIKCFRGKKSYLSCYLEAYARKKQGYMDEVTRGLFEFSMINSPAIFRNIFAFRYVEFLREMGVVKSEKILEYDDLISRWNIFSKVRYSKLCLELASAAVENQQYNIAEHWFNKNPRNFEILKNYLPLRFFLQNKYSILDEEDLKSMRNIVQPSMSLRNLIVKNKNSYCIVGNSPNVMGKKMGKRIDSYNLVIRFNNFSTSEDYIEDIGSKTDVWVRMLPTSLITQKPNRNMKLIVFTGANSLNRSISKHDSLFGLSRAGYNIDFFEKDIFFELQKKIGAPPSSGLVICYTIFKILGDISSRDVYGLSMGEEFSKYNSYHCSDKEAKPADRHRWEKEKEIFKSMGLCQLS